MRRHRQPRWSAQPGDWRDDSGLGGALFEAIEFENGRIKNPRFSSYRVPRFRDLPEIEATLLDRKDLPSAGAGETPIMAVAPAIGNAIFDATGIRLNNLPMIPNGLPPAQDERMNLLLGSEKLSHEAHPLSFRTHRHTFACWRMQKTAERQRRHSRRHHAAPHRGRYSEYERHGHGRPKRFHQWQSAHAEVVFRPKTGAPAGAGMQIAYNLEKRDGAWVVQKSQSVDG